MKTKGFLVSVACVVVISGVVGSIALAQTKSSGDKLLARQLRDIKESIQRIEARLDGIQSVQDEILTQVKNIKIWVRKQSG